MTKDKYILWGIPVIFIIGSVFHFIYEFTGDNFIIGLIAPVNESVFEHMKMVPVPVLIWWIVGCVKFKPDKDIWFSSCLISLILGTILVPLIYYFYTSAFGIEIIIVDILILFIAVLLGQLLALHYFEHGSGINYKIALGIMVAVIVVFAIFTLFPPKLPIFMDRSTGTYGINQTT
ncbi:MAG: DUF6512 family protein [Clostridia bacterium]